MKIVYVLSALFLMFAVPAFAGVPAKTELSLAGQFVNGSDAADDWTLNFDLTFPLNKNGNLLLGPAVAIGEADELNRLGARLDWNLFGQKPVTLYVGAVWQYFVKSRDEGPQDVTMARGGFKVPVGKGAAIDLAYLRVVDGVGKDETDDIVSAGIIARF